MSQKDYLIEKGGITKLMEFLENLSLETHFKYTYFLLHKYNKAKTILKKSILKIQKEDIEILSVEFVPIEEKKKVIK